MFLYIASWLVFIGLSFLVFLLISLLIFLTDAFSGSHEDTNIANQACLNALLTNVVTDEVRNLFHQHHPKDPKVLYNELTKPQNESVLKKLKKNKILSDMQYELLYPNDNSKESHSTKYDISLLTVLLKSICYTPPLKGWKTIPPINDHSIQAEIVRIQAARNKMIHKTVEDYDDATFESLWNEFRDALISLGCNPDRIDKENRRRYPFLLRCKHHIRYFFSVILEKSIGTSIFLYEITVNKYYRQCKKEDGVVHKTDNITLYYERADLLQRLLTTIENKQASVYGIVIAGPGGIGKTELAKSICNKLKNTYSHIIWMGAETDQEIKQEFLVLYYNLKLDYVDRRESADTKYDSKSIAYKVYDFFSDEDAVLVFDNVVSYDDIKEFLPILQTGRKSPLIIMTSQLKTWNQTQFTVEEVGVFTEEEAIGFIHNNCQNNKESSEEAIKELVGELSCLPLGLVSAVSYLNDNLDYNVDRYLEEYKEFAEDILDQNIAKTTGYDKTALTTCKMTMKKLDLPSIRLIQLLSYFDGKKINKNLLTYLNIFKNDALLQTEKNICLLTDSPKLNKAITQLNDYSLIDESYETNLNGKVKFITVHSLIQTVVRLGRIVNGYKKEHMTLLPKIVIEIISIAIKNDQGKQTHYDYGMDWIRHLYQTLTVCQTDDAVIDHFLDKNNEQAVKDALISKGNYILCHKIFQILIQKTAEPKLLSMRSIMAYSLLKMGKYKQSEKEYNTLLTHAKHIKDSEDTDIVNAEYFVGHCLMKQEDYKTAIEKLENVGDKQLKVFTAQSKEYLLTQHDIAYSMFKLAQYEEALKRFQEIFVQQEMVCGEHHKDTLLTSHSIGHTLIELGRYEEAKDHLYKTLCKKQKAFGDLHHETLITHHTLGLTLLHLNELTEAREILYEVYENKVKALGKENPSTLTTYHRVGNAFMKDDLYEDALKIFEDVLELRKKVIGPEKERTLMTENDVGTCYMNLKRYDEAIATFERIDVIQVRMFGDKKINSMATKFNLAKCYREKNDFIKAVNVLEELLTLQEGHFGIEHEKSKEAKAFLEECTELLKKNQ